MEIDWERWVELQGFGPGQGGYIRSVRLGKGPLHRMVTLAKELRGKGFVKFTILGDGVPIDADIEELAARPDFPKVG